MDKIYYLDLQTLLDYLQGQSAVLYASLDMPDVRGPCNGYIFLREGSIIDCLIQSQDGVQLRTGKDAYTLLSTKSEWQVRIDPNVEWTLRYMQQQGAQEWNTYTPYMSPPSPMPAPTPPASIYVPRPIRPLESHLLTRYTMKQCLILRMVFAMVNGERTIEQIKGQLHLSPEVVDEALTNLHSLSVIE